MAGTIEAILSLKGTGFKQGLDQAKADASKFKGEVGGMFSGVGKSIAGALTVGGAVASMRSIVGFAGGLQDTADALGMNVEALQELRHAFGQSGASAEQVDKALTKLTQSLAAARGGNETAIGSFAKLGITMQQIQSLSADQILMRMAEGFSASADPAASLAASMELLGRGSRGMAAGFAAGADELSRLREEAAVLNEQAIADLDQADDAITSVMNKIKVMGGQAILGIREIFRPVNPNAATNSTPAATDEELAKLRAGVSARQSSAMPVSVKPSDKEFAEADKMWQTIEDAKIKAANARIDEEREAQIEMERAVAKVREERRAAERENFERDLAAKEQAITDAAARSQANRAAAAEARGDAFDQAQAAIADDILAGPNARREKRRADRRREQAMRKAKGIMDRANVVRDPPPAAVDSIARIEPAQIAALQQGLADIRDKLEATK